MIILHVAVLFCKVLLSVLYVSSHCIGELRMHLTKSTMISRLRDILKLYDTSITENFCEFKQMYFKSLFSISI